MQRINEFTFFVAGHSFKVWLQEEEETGQDGEMLFYPCAEEILQEGDPVAIDVWSPNVDGLADKQEVLTTALQNLIHYAASRSHDGAQVLILGRSGPAHTDIHRPC
jgi:hypothetical protein